MSKNKTVAAMLGEAVDVAEPDEMDQAVAAAEPEEPPRMDYSNPSVDQLVGLWQSGQHEAVALRVLDALDHYADFLELAFQIGHDDAIELGHTMDAMTSEEHSPHTYDTVPDQEVSVKTMSGGQQLGNVHNSAGE